MKCANNLIFTNQTLLLDAVQQNDVLICGLGLHVSCSSVVLLSSLDSKKRLGPLRLLHGNDCGLSGTDSGFDLRRKPAKHLPTSLHSLMMPL